MVLIQTNLAHVSEEDRSGKTERMYSYVWSLVVVPLGAAMLIPLAVAFRD
jgi:hypothetical protein